MEVCSEAVNIQNDFSKGLILKIKSFYFPINKLQKSVIIW